MVDAPDMFEGRLVGYSKQSRKDGDWIEVRFHIHPNDVTPALAAAPLKTAFMVAAVPAQKTEEPEKPGKRHWDEIPLPEQAGIRCNDPLFQEWLRARYFPSSKLNEDPKVRLIWAEQTVRVNCGRVDSRAEFSPDNEPGRQWIVLDQEFRQSQGLITEER